MRTHVWRKSFTRLSQRNQRLPIRRQFHAAARQLNAGGREGPDHDKSEADKDATRKLSDDNAEEGKTRKPSTRRSRLYSKQPREVPTFTLPNWFLKHNVRLQDASVRDKSDNSLRRSLNLVDRDTGHIVLTLPFADLVNADVQPDTSTASTASAKPDAFFSWKGTAVDHDTVPPANANATTTKSPDAPLADGQPTETDARRAAKQLSSAPTDTAPEPRLLMFLQVQLLLNAAFQITGPTATRLLSPNLELRTSDSLAQHDLDEYVEQLADLMRADLIRLDANDIAELAAEYIDNGDYESGSISALPYDVYKGQGPLKAIEIDLADDFAPDEPSDSQEGDPDHVDDAFASSPFSGIDIGRIGQILRRNIGKLSSLESRGAIAIPLSQLRSTGASSTSENGSRGSSSFVIGSWDELKLQTLLDTLLDSTAAKRDASSATAPDTFLRNTFRDAEVPADASEHVSGANKPPRQPQLARLLKEYLVNHVDADPKEHSISAVVQDDSSTDLAETASDQYSTRTIFHVRDLEAIQRTSQGEAIIRMLAKVLQRRRKDGQQIVMVGTSANSQQSVMDRMDPEDDDEETSFRTIQYLSAASSQVVNVTGLLSSMSPLHKSGRSLAKSGTNRLLDINLRNIQSMVRRLGLTASDLMFSSQTRSHMNIIGTWKLAEYALTQDEVQQIVLYAESLRTIYTQSPRLETFHIALAAALKQSIESILGPLTGFQVEPVIPTARPRGSSKGSSDSPRRSPGKVDIEQLKKTADKHEKKLLGGVVDPQSLKTTFADVHAPEETIEALKTLTSLSLLRPEAFSYGVLANDRLPGLLLYGPPGTGKTMLAKAVAKESQATVLEVSGAQVYEKYVGEGEKMVKAVFSLAKKLSPCVVFIDEADALFGSRGGANRTTHREIINQFLREWDGMDDHSVFMMVATNRPFDLDDAVLRRLPRRLLVDLPVAKDRESILGIHLKGETLDSSVDLKKLSEQMPLYSGSDLKNVCVAAALAAVREENELLVQHKDDKAFKLPERRTLTGKHFEKAIAEISASISEDMTSLVSIRKFDEQYGDRRAKRKKSAYGFGTMETEADERAARVRQDDAKP